MSAASTSLRGDVDAALAAAPDIARETTAFHEDAAGRLGLLRAVGAHDLTTARALEPHLDAVEILAEAGLTPAGVDATPRGRLSCAPSDRAMSGC